MKQIRGCVTIFIFIVVYLYIVLLTTDCFRPYTAVATGRQGFLYETFCALIHCDSFIVHDSLLMNWLNNIWPPSRDFQDLYKNIFIMIFLKVLKRFKKSDQKKISTPQNVTILVLQSDEIFILSLTWLIRVQFRSDKIFWCSQTFISTSRFPVYIFFYQYQYLKYSVTKYRIL